MNTENTIKYFAYVRKSTEGEERQALSIESQIDSVRNTFPDLEIVDILEKKHSAFKPYNRPVFDDMIRRIKKGEARGIIAWHPDRLSRNEIDASTITYLVRTNIIHDLKFGSYNFDNSPEGIMMLQLALSQSQYFSSKLGKDVKRGLEKKLQMGWRPGLAPEGYLNIIGELQGLKGIKIDRKKFTLLRKAFNLMLTGNYSAMEILDKLNNLWGYRTHKRRKSGGNKLSKSTWYKMLSSPFYAGIVIYNNEEYKGKHKPLITLDEFNRIQDLLSLKGSKRRPKERNFTFTGLFTCGNCNSSITAEHKTKYIKSESKVRGYDYYHCTHKKKGFNCKEGSIEEKELEKQIKGLLTKLKLHPKFLDWALEYIEGEKGKEKEEKKTVEKNVENAITNIEKQISNLTLMRSKELIDDEEYKGEKEKLKKDIEKLKGKSKNNKSEDELLELTKEQFIFAVHALNKFQKGDKKAKKEVVLNLGSNRKILGKKMLISVYKWLLPILENAKKLNQELARLEPTKTLINTTKKEAFASLRLCLHGW